MDKEFVSMLFYDPDKGLDRRGMRLSTEIRKQSSRLAKCIVLMQPTKVSGTEM